MRFIVSAALRNSNDTTDNHSEKDKTGITNMQDDCKHLTSTLPGRPQAL